MSRTRTFLNVAAIAITTGLFPVAAGAHEAPGPFATEAAPGAGTQLWVNGDTPSRRYQRDVSTMGIRTPDVRLAVYMVGPDRPWPTGCAELGAWAECIDSGRRGVGAAMWLAFDRRIMGPVFMRSVLRHAIGHLIDHAWMTDEQRAEFAAWVGRADKPWRVHGDTFSTHEQFADTAMMCSFPRDRRFHIWWQGPRSTGRFRASTGPAIHPVPEWDLPTLDRICGFFKSLR